VEKSLMCVKAVTYLVVKFLITSHCYPPYSPDGLNAVDKAHFS
jgi:hypothetical protein